MSFIFDSATEDFTFKPGMNGNYYVYSKSKNSIIDVCNKIEKSNAAIYLNKRYNVWVIKIKSRIHKDNLKKLLKDIKKL